MQVVLGQGVARKCQHRTGLCQTGLVKFELPLSLSMANNGSSVNTANIITALGNAFKDPSGAALPNDRLAAVLIQNMNQLNDLAKEGKLNQQQIVQVCS